MTSGCRAADEAPSRGPCASYSGRDVWTIPAYRRQGIASAMVRPLLESAPNRCAGLQTGRAQPFPSSLGFRPQPKFWSSAGGTWLDDDANR